MLLCIAALSVVGYWLILIVAGWMLHVDIRCRLVLLVVADWIELAGYWVLSYLECCWALLLVWFGHYWKLVGIRRYWLALNFVGCGDIVCQWNLLGLCCWLLAVDTSCWMLELGGSCWILEGMWFLFGCYWIFLMNVDGCCWIVEVIWC